MKKLVLGLVISASATLAQAQNQLIYSSEGGMPRCFEQADRGDSDGLMIFFSRDKYERQVYDLNLNHAFSVFLRDSGPMDIRKSIAKGARFNIFCKNWKGVTDVRLTDFKAMMKEVTPQTTQIEGYVFDPKTLKAFEQIRGGGDEYTDLTPAQFLAANPIEEFTTEINRQLTARFGVGYAGQVYKSWILSNPTNMKFANQVKTDIPSFLGAKAAGPVLTQTFKKRVVLLVKGLGNDQISAKRYDFLAILLPQLGIDLKILAPGAYAPLLDNAAMVQAKIDEILSAGSDLVVISLSKGTIESALAISRLRHKIETQPGYGKVRAFVSLSGIYDASFLLTFATQPLIGMISKYLIRKDYRDNGQVPPYTLEGINDLSEARMAIFRGEIERNGLPQNINFVSVVTIPPGHGLSKDVAISALQDGISRRFISWAGANDGYVEFPGTMVPRSWTTKRYVMSTDASHVFIDGQFAGYKLDDDHQDNRRALIGSMMSQIGKILDREDRSK
jgi:hypothetical protein